MDEKSFEGALPRTEDGWKPFLNKFGDQKITDDSFDPPKIVGVSRKYSIWQRADLMVSVMFEGPYAIVVELTPVWEDMTVVTRGAFVDEQIDRAVRMVEAGLSKGSRYWKDLPLEELFAKVDTQELARECMRRLKEDPPPSPKEPFNRGAPMYKGVAF